MSSSTTPQAEPEAHRGRQHINVLALGLRTAEPPLTVIDHGKRPVRPFGMMFLAWLSCPSPVGRRPGLLVTGRR